MVAYTLGLSFMHADGSCALYSFVCMILHGSFLTKPPACTCVFVALRKEMYAIRRIQLRMRMSEVSLLAKYDTKFWSPISIIIL